MALKKTIKNYWIVVEEGNNNGEYHNHYCSSEAAAMELAATIKWNPWNKETVADHIAMHPEEKWMRVYETNFELFEEQK